MQNYIYGAGGHGKVVLDAMQVSKLSCTGFVDDKSAEIWFGLPVFRLSAVTQKSDNFYHLAIGSCKIRATIASHLTDMKYFTVTHTSAVLARSAHVGEGTFLAAQSVVGPDAKIGMHCIINHGAIVDHDCVVGDFSHIAPHASLGGGVVVGKGVLVGAGAIILPNIIIADYAVIGAGSVVTKNVMTGATVVGNPGRTIK